MQINTVVRAMKLTAVILLACFLQAHANVFSQSITLAEKDAPLEKVFRDIEKLSGYQFFYADNDLKLAKKITLDVHEMDLSDLLKLCFTDQPLAFSITEKTIMVKLKEPGEKDANAVHATGDIHGHVTDSTGAPLAGASITVKGIRKGTLTDAKGNFTLKNVGDDAILLISYTGYLSKEIKWSNGSDLPVILIRSNNPLDAVQVIAYGTTTARLNTGDVTTVTAKEIEEQPVSNPLAAMEGRVPGLVINQNTGVPGGSFSVQIRGQNSLVNGNDPFYVIDGVPYNSQFPNANATGLLNSSFHGGSPLNFLNPYDIESIEVLKDADATAIYGSRAANGAILITTKKGKEGATSYSFNIYSGVGKVPHDINLLNTAQYLQMRHEAFNNDGETPGPADHDINGDWDSTRYTNWQKILVGNLSHYDNAQISVSGGNASTQFLIGGGYHRETTPFLTLLPGDGADQKLSLHFNINNTSLNKKLKINLTGGYLSDKNTIQSTDFFYDALVLAPDAPALFNPDNRLNWAPLSPGQIGTWSNPLALLLESYKGLTNNIVGNAIMNYNILPGLEIKASLGYNYSQTSEIQTTPTSVYDPGLRTPSGNSGFNTISANSWIIEPQADYKLQLGRSTITVLFGGTFLENSTNQQYLAASGFSSDAVLQNIQAASAVSVQYSNSTQYKYNAVFGRLNYNWEDKYLINFTGRRDGSSRFGPGKQFADFGAVGAAWIFSKENFFQNNLNRLSFGKLRASYGSAGNDQVGDYQFLDLYGTTTYPYQNIQGFYPSNLFNPDLAWEINRKLELGIELGFLKDRIRFSASYYYNRSSNQLVTSPLSAVTGFTSIPENLPAIVQNTGQEFMLSTINIKSKRFSWSSSLNLTFARNKLIYYPNLANSVYSQQFIIGQPITIQKAVHSTGVNDTAGIYEFTDSKGMPTYGPTIPDDQTVLINTVPKYYGGLLNSFSYAGFSLDIFFQFVKQIGRNFFNADQNMPGTLANQPVADLERWQKPGDMKPYQQFSQDYSSNAANSLSTAQFYSDLAFSDASYIRLKNIALSWQLPTTIRKKLSLQNCRIYFQGQNLLTFTHYSGIDPETQGTILPPLRVYTLGFQLNLQ